MYIHVITGLQMRVGHRTLADQTLLMSDEIPCVVGHDVRTIFWIVNHFRGTVIKIQPFLLVMSDQNFVMSDQDHGTLVGHMSFQVKQIICSPVINMERASY